MTNEICLLCGKGFLKEEPEGQIYYKREAHLKTIHRIYSLLERENLSISHFKSEEEYRRKL